VVSNEQYLTDLFIYQAESLAASDVDMIDGDDFEIEYDGGHSGDVSIRGLMAEVLKRLRKAEADRDRLKAELIREQAATEAMDAIDGEDGDFANVRGVVERMIAAGYRKQAEGNGDE